MPDSSSTTTDREKTRRDHRRRNLTVAGVLVIALALLIGGAVRLVLPMFTEGSDSVTDYPGPGSGQVAVVVADPAPEPLAVTLVEAGVVATTDAFVDAYENNPEASGIEAGSYTLAQQMKASDAVAALLDPANRTDRSLTIPPGWRESQILAKVAEVMGISLADVDDAAAELELPDAAGGELEGWLYAESYMITPDETVVEVLQRMVDRTVEVLDSHDVGADDRQDILTEASIVEAEVTGAENRGKVARVMQNRFDGCTTSGKPYLQMNSTVAYGLNKSVTDLTLADLEDDSTPYNTYMFEGLPPTPINSPSDESIEAVLSPPEGDWCYFVTVDLETGETLFTADPAEHEENKARYRDWLEQWREDQSAAAEDSSSDSEG